MARVFRHTFSKRLPDGRRVTRACSKWYIEYRDSTGKLRRLPGYTDKRATEAQANELQRRVDRQAAGILDAESLNLTAQLVAPIREHLDAYETNLRACGVSAQHLSETCRRLKRLFDDCAFERLVDLRSEPVQKWVTQRQREQSVGENGPTGMGPRTINTHLSSLRAFIRWCIADGRMVSDPLVTLKKADEAADVRRARRSLTEDEFVRLLDIAARRPLLDASKIRRGKRIGDTAARLKDETREQLEQLGRERRLIYSMLVLTGLRKGELTQLRWADVDLDERQAWLTVRASVAKNGKTETLPIRADLAVQLRAWKKDRENPSAAEKVFRVPRGLARILERDLVACGIAKRVQDAAGRWRIEKRDDQGRTIDVHALRHTTATFLAKSGVAPRTAQSIMRHSDIRLTLGTYTDPRLLDTAKALDGLPSLSAAPESCRARATGTFGEPVSELGARLGVTTRPNTHRGAQTCAEGGEDRRAARKRQVPVRARVGNVEHDDSQQRATRLERATFSLEG